MLLGLKVDSPEGLTVPSALCWRQLGNWLFECCLALRARRTEVGQVCRTVGRKPEPVANQIGYSQRLFGQSQFAAIAAAASEPKEVLVEVSYWLLVELVDNVEMGSVDQTLNR